MIRFIWIINTDAILTRSLFSKISSIPQTHIIIGFEFKSDHAYQIYWVVFISMEHSFSCFSKSKQQSTSASHQLEVLLTAVPSNHWYFRIVTCQSCYVKPHCHVNILLTIVSSSYIIKHHVNPKGPTTYSIKLIAFHILIDIRSYLRPI